MIDLLLWMSVFFFFQAEDGIRDYKVTGVQTCALPICMWTDAGSIIDYLVYARDFISQCEERHGLTTVEQWLDSCHALSNLGVDRYRRPSKKSLARERAEREQREAYAQQQVNELWRTLPARPGKDSAAQHSERFPKEPEENLLYFIEKNAPLLEPWQREIVRIVRKIAQYFYPQRQRSEE